MELQLPGKGKLILTVMQVSWRFTMGGGNEAIITNIAKISSKSKLIKAINKTRSDL
jgi:hypothetical protein